MHVPHHRRRVGWVCCGLLVHLLDGGSGFTRPQADLRAEDLEFPAGTRIARDVSYCSPDDGPLRLDLYRPPAPGRRPVAIYVHGGGWHGGDKAAGADMVDLPELVRRGYAVASINYRHAPRYRFPAQIEDVKCAIRFLRAQAATLDLDPDRVGAWGASAGGHLVALAALTPGDPRLEGDGEHMTQSSRLEAAVLFYAPADLAADDLPPRTLDIFHRVFGDTPDELTRGSPVTHVHAAAPPFLLLHGDADASVPLSQSQRLYERLRKAGVPVQLVVVRNAGHVFEPVGGPIVPARPAITATIIDFFDWTLAVPERDAN